MVEVMNEPLTWEQVLENRRIWIDYLAEPDRKKATSVLDLGNEERCCLGHACFLFEPESGKDEIDRVWYGKDRDVSYATNRVKNLLGLKSNAGRFNYSLGGSGHMRVTRIDGELVYVMSDDTVAMNQVFGGVAEHVGAMVIQSLAELNDADSLNVTPQEIAKVLESIGDSEVSPFLSEQEWKANQIG